jgi:exonuclease III
MTEFQNLNITFSAINCNSMNVSTLGNRNSKTYLKIEGVTGKKSDIILMSDIRAKNKGDEFKKMFGLTRNGSYKLYINSNKESRGVGIAIKRNIYHDIKRVYNGTGDDNVILLDVVIKNVRLTIGTVYGPNRNDTDFYIRIRRQIELWGNRCILGGDFNTILCRDMGIGNLDREGGDRVPNRQNSNVINGWIGQNFLIDPFRALYPEAREYSYIPFRSRGGRDGVNGDYGKTRLDFFLISTEILGAVDNVIYEDRIGSDFDHKEVKMVIGKKKENSKIVIKDTTLEDCMVIDNGLVAVYESIRNHLATADDRLTEHLTQLDILLREKETVFRMYERRGLREEMGDRLEHNNVNINVVKGRLPNLADY